MEKEPEQIKLTHLSRRDFLKIAGGALLASALGGIPLACEAESNGNSLFDPPSSSQGTPGFSPILTEAAPVFTPEKYVSLRFLTNPFPDNPKMTVQQGWFYNWQDKDGSPAKHQGIDFVKGEIDDSKTWEPFAVLAAADGWVCANPPLRLGNALFMIHIVNGNPLYTYYGHLEKIEKDIPPYNDKERFLGGIPIRRGKRIGVAGASGVTNEKDESEPTWIHLHFGVQDDNGTLDPYDLHGQREMYPNPSLLSSKKLGSRSMWK